LLLVYRLFLLQSANILDKATMRRSKSNPAKYARNYRSISQRQMTKYDGTDEAEEMKRLKAVLKHSQDHLQNHGKLEEYDDDDDSGDKKKKKKISIGSNDDMEVKDIPKQLVEEESEESAIERARNMLRNSTDHLKFAEEMDEENDVMQLKPLKKKKKRNRKALDNDNITTHDEDREGSQPKSADTTTDSQGDLFDTATKKISNDATDLMSNDFMKEHAALHDNAENPLVVLPSKKKQRSKKKSKIELTPEEIKQAKLLQKNTQRKLNQLATRAEQKKKRTVLYEKLSKTAISSEEMTLLSSSSTLGKRVSKKEQLKRLIQKERAGMTLTSEERDLLYRDRKTTEDDNDDDDHDNSGAKTMTSSSNAESSTKKRKIEKKGADSDKNNQETTSYEKEAPPAANFFAAQMMASLATLKNSSEKQKQENEIKRQEEQDEKRRLEEERIAKLSKKVPYKPQEPIVIQTAATNRKLQVHPLPKSDRRVLSINRPKEVEEARYDLPVTQMEFEVIDAIRNHDVIIICGETGSGKSTQIPQLVYESGFTLDPKQKDSDAKEKKYLIGITQPRRVAAISTAKRVSYEMGSGDGQSIKSSKRSDGNVVSYQTRYESAGLGQKTAVKFMTDGILLQEIQSDLLLRKYSVIVLDECHERNLNCGMCWQTIVKY